MVTLHVDRSTLGDITALLDAAVQEAVWWALDESLTEDELIRLARDAHTHPGASSLLQAIAMHPAVGDEGLRGLVAFALSTDDIGVLNAVVTLQKAPEDVLRRLRRHRSRSVREHVKINLDGRRGK
jgi:hypothetical protein